jgi:hypothetical protein
MEERLMKPEIFTRDSHRGQRWFVRLGDRICLDAAKQDGFTSYDEAKAIADQLAVDPDSVEPCEPDTDKGKKKPPVVPPKSETQRTIQSWSRSHNIPRPIKLDPTTKEGFVDIARATNIANAWAQRVRALEERLDNVLAIDPYNFTHIKSLRKALATAKLGQQYA